jgi:hypothetical protein
LRIANKGLGDYLHRITQAKELGQSHLNESEFHGMAQLVSEPIQCQGIATSALEGASPLGVSFPKNQNMLILGSSLITCA